MKNKGKKRLSMLLGLFMLFSTLNLPTIAATVTQHIIISQVYGGGGNSGADYAYDFIELYNPTNSSVNLEGWSVQYTSAAGNSYSNNRTALSGDIAPGEYYLIRQAKGSGSGTIEFPEANVIGNINMSGTSGKVALVSSTTGITSKEDISVVDFVGFGTANEYEGGSAAPTLSNVLAAVRKFEGVDTDDNGVDFVAQAPNPRKGTLGDETKCATPTASVPSGSVPLGTEVLFSSATVGASIEYTTSSAYAIDWTTGSAITIDEDVTYYVRATQAGLSTSDVATFSYVIDHTKLVTIEEAKAAPLNTQNIKVEGVVTYKSGRNVYIQDDTGAICLYLNASAIKLNIGDLIVATGKRDLYGNLIELSGIDESSIVVKSSGNAIPDRGKATVEQLIDQPEGKTPGYNHMCEMIQVEGATLTSLSLLSQNGSQVTIYPAVNLSNYVGIAIGDAVDVTVRMYDYNGTLQVAITEMTKSGDQGKLTLSVSPDSGRVTSGTEVSIACNHKGATIYYTLDGSEPSGTSQVYSGPIAITGEIGDTVQLKVIAVADGEDDSEVFSAQYTIKDANESLNIKEVLTLPSGTKEVRVTGQIVYFATSYANPVIQSEIDGEVYSLYIFGAGPEGAKVGDLVELIGTYTIYNGLPELMSITQSQILDSQAPMEPQTVTISEIKNNGLKMLGRFVKIENVTLGTYVASGSTNIKDSTGSINIYNATSYPALVEVDDVVDLYAMIACYNATVQLYTGTKGDNGFNVYDIVDDKKPPVILLPESYLDAKINQDYIILVEAKDNKGIDKVTVSYKIGETTVANQEMIVNESGKYEYTIPGSEIVSSAENIKFTIKAEDVTGLSTTSVEQIIPINDAPQVIAVAPERNSSTGDNQSPVISVTLENAGAEPTVTLSLQKGTTSIVTNQAMNKELSESKNVYSQKMQNLEDGTYNATVTIIRKEDSKSATVTWNFTVGTPKYRAYFGQLHAHTAQYSDGSGTLADGLNYLKNISKSDNVDFVSFTDHSNYFDTTAASNPAEALNDKSKMTTASLSLWNTYVSDMEKFNDDNAGSLVALPGFEMTWSGGPGHINTFNSDGLVSRNNTTLNNKTGDSGLKAYYETLIADTNPLANLSQFNHPGTTFGTFSDFAYWSPAYDRKMVAVEVGNGEGAIGSGGYFPSYAEYTKALDKGWHVAPSNNQDNHKGRWGNANTARTVIITDDFSSEGLLTGLKNMSVYATEDKNLNIEYTVNDLMMGSVISEVPTEPLQFDIRINDPDQEDTISKVEIVTNGGFVAASQNFSSNVVNWRFELTPTQGYYYVRVTQADKNIAVTAPIWVGSAPLVGISSFESNTKMPVTGESLTLTSTLFNNEADKVILKSIEYVQGNTILKTETLNTELASQGTFKHTLSYTPISAGSVEITVKTIISINGEERIFTMDADLEVRDSEKLVYIGIDASHYNEYVSGNYKDNMGNFANLAMEYDVRVVELSTNEELIQATKNPKYKMLVLTPPTRRNGSNFLIGYKSYSDEVIAAIAEFAQLGNTLIITSWGDYYESYTKYSDGTPHTLPPSEHMSVQQNKLLEAIGSNLRVSDDELKDDQKNGGQPQRLYLENYNMKNVFLQGVKPLEQVYSNYAGSTIYGVGEDRLPSSTLADTISPMVYAFDTSYSADDDKDGTTGIAGIAVPKYDGKYMAAASEMITYENGVSSMVIVAGSAFMSNFEIQVEMDNYSTPAYSNYTILENIIKSINEVSISDIAELHAGDEGVTFTIRGIVTSNASGYDKETAFFDSIYVQDETAGINVFPVSEEIRAGQTVEIVGRTSSYNGERQINVNKITIIDKTIKPLPEPIVLTTAEAANGSHLGSLVKVTGAVVDVEYSNNVVENIYIKDSSGIQSRIFIDGYITSDKVIDNLEIGAQLTAIGFSSIDAEGKRIRIRDRDDITCTVEDNGSGDDGSQSKKDLEITTQEKVSDTTFQYIVDNAIIRGYIDEIQASKNNQDIIEITVDADGDKKYVEIIISKTAIDQIVTLTPQVQFKINTPRGNITFSQEAIKRISEEANSENISIQIGLTDYNDFSSSAKQLIGDRPGYEFLVIAGNKEISIFGKEGVKINLPYMLRPGEDMNSILVYHIDNTEKPQKTRSNYNPLTKTVDFVTDHFSTYAIGYNPKVFTDVKETDWYYNAVAYISAREISTGTAENTFSPNMALTRGQFIVLLMNAYNIQPDENISTNFADAGNTYYTGYLAAAKRVGIAAGVGNNLFAPNEVISRQDMISLLYNVLHQVNELPQSEGHKKLTDFSDTVLISDYAQIPMQLMVERGVISGKDGILDPKGTATRAEMAQILYNLLILR
jgi:hypothetical protein